MGGDIVELKEVVEVHRDQYLLLRRAKVNRGIPCIEAYEELWRANFSNAHIELSDMCVAMYQGSLMLTDRALYSPLPHWEVRDNLYLREGGAGKAMICLIVSINNEPHLLMQQRGKSDGITKGG